MFALVEIFALIKLFLVLLLSVKQGDAMDANVLITEVFAIPLDPPMFNWTYEGKIDQYVYQASMRRLPDLPDWISYLFSERHRKGFLYGVAPTRRDPLVPLEVVALNKRTYETRAETLNVAISEKLNRARYEVHMQINDLNVDDLFDAEKMDALKDIFRKQLWKDSEEDLYVTFLGSAVELGARKPLRPSEGEGIVIRLGSGSKFSDYLEKLEQEVKPIKKSPSCHYKKTTMERFFKESGFNLDWCYFELIGHENADAHHSETNQHFSLKDEQSYDSSSGEDVWRPILKAHVPKRSYIGELLISTLVPTMILIVLVLLLSFLLCFQHEDIEDEDSEVYFENLFHICEDFYYDYYIYKVKRGSYVEDRPTEDLDQYETIRRATESLRNFSNTRDARLSPDDFRSYTNSPNSTLGQGHGVHCRPSPPPYVRPKFKPEF